MVVMEPSASLPSIARDAGAFEDFYREHLPSVRTFVARRVDDPLQAADLTADVFVRVLHSASTYRASQGPPRAWVIGIARHVVLDHRRGRVREAAAVRRLQGRQLLDADSSERIVDRIVAERDARSLLASIAELPPSLRAVVELVAVEGLSTTDAAQVLGISAGAARVRYHRGRRILRACPNAPTTIEATT